MEKYAEDERIEQLNDQKRRIKQQEHKRAVDAMIADRREQRARDAAEELELDKMQDEFEQYRQEVIEQERQRLLREHAANLIGYLPRGVLRDEKDLDLFDEEFKAKFRPQADMDV